MVRLGSPLQKLTENGVYIITVRLTILNQRKEIINASYGRDRAFEKKKIRYGKRWPIEMVRSKKNSVRYRQGDKFGRTPVLEWFLKGFVKILFLKSFTFLTFNLNNNLNRI